MEFSQLCEEAKKVLRPRILSKHVRIGDVACALETEDGHVYTGICIDAACSIGFCAEHAAISAMLNAGETHILRLVALSEHGVIYPPCGRCRELMSQIDEKNIDTEILIGDHEVKRLEDLLPYDWKKIR